jgi:hypothetical protein
LFFTSGTFLEEAKNLESKPATRRASTSLAKWILEKTKALGGSDEEDFMVSAKDF